MSNIAKVKLSDTVDYQRNRLNEVIDVANTSNSNITVLENETKLPDPSVATANIYLIRLHTKYKGPVIATLINNIYKFAPLKNDVINGNSYIYVDSTQLGTGITINKCVYLDTNGVWKLADSTDESKIAEGIVGPYNSIILGGIVTSSSLNLTPGLLYYYDNTGSLTSTQTSGKVGLALNTNTLIINFSYSLDNVIQPDWNQTNSGAEDYIKNKPGVVSKTAIGFVPQLPNETTVTKFLRQDGTWSIPSYPASISPTGGAMTGTLSDKNAAQVRNFQILTEEQATGNDGWLYGVVES